MGSDGRVHRDGPSHRLEPQAGRLPLVRHDLIPAFRCVHPLVGVSALCCTRHWGDKLVEYHQTLASHESRRNVRLPCYYWITFLRFWQSGPSLLVGDGLGPAIREKHPQSHSLSASETSESSESSTSSSSTSASLPHSLPAVNIIGIWNLIINYHRYYMIVSLSSLSILLLSLSLCLYVSCLFYSVFPCLQSKCFSFSGWPCALNNMSVLLTKTDYRHCSRCGC